MLTDLVRDHIFTIAWFGVMTVVWLGWGQEDPPQRWRPWMGAGSVLGLVVAGVFGYALVRHWGGESALEGDYHWFGLLVLAEVLAAGIGCLVLWRRGQSRWMAWWVGLVIALHFVPLTWLLRDWSLLGLAAVQMIGLLLILPRLRGADREHSTSRWVGPVMGVALLLFAAASAAVFLARYGSPF